MSKPISRIVAMNALEDMDDYARMDRGVEPIGPYAALKSYILHADVIQPNWQTAPAVGETPEYWFQRYTQAIQERDALQARLYAHD